MAARPADLDRRRVHGAACTDHDWAAGGCWLRDGAWTYLPPVVVTR